MVHKIKDDIWLLKCSMLVILAQGMVPIIHVRQENHKKSMMVSQSWLGQCGDAFILQRAKNTSIIYVYSNYLLLKYLILVNQMVM